MEGFVSSRVAMMGNDNGRWKILGLRWLYSWIPVFDSRRPLR